jgi:hypothetical protein
MDVDVGWAWVKSSVGYVMASQTFLQQQGHTGHLVRCGGASRAGGHCEGWRVKGDPFD